MLAVDENPVSYLMVSKDTLNGSETKFGRVVEQLESSDRHVRLIEKTLAQQSILWLSKANEATAIQENVVELEKHATSLSADEGDVVCKM